VQRFLSALAALLIAAVALVALPIGMPSQAAAQDDPSFRIVVIPDTQMYVQTEAGNAYFVDQAQWIADTAAATNTVFVTHVGDVVQNPNDPVEWDRGEAAMAIIEAAGLPYGIAPGNHDMTNGGGETLYDMRFSADRFADTAWFSGRHEAEGNRSSFQIVSVEGHDLLFLHIRHLQETYGDVDDVLAWVDLVLSAHPDHLTFVTTHEFTSPDNSIVMRRLETVLSDHCTVAAVFSGHRFGAATGEFTDTCGRPVRHLLTNYQGFTDGGLGFLRTVDINPYTLDASFAVFSPTLDENRTDPVEQFTVALSPLPLVSGDVNCDRIVNVIDALFITQYDVQVRTDLRSTCPLPTPQTQLNVTVGDFNQDGLIDVVDALQISQCEVAVANEACPG